MQDASFHLAADDGAEDFRADGALSTSAPKVKPRFLADVLWEAANVYLLGPFYWPHTAESFSCNAALAAEYFGIERVPIKEHDYDRKASKTNSFLTELGCDPSKTAFKDIDGWDERQGVRYMWLLLAMHVAEDEGITL